MGAFTAWWHIWLSIFPLNSNHPYHFSDKISETITPSGLVLSCDLAVSRTQVPITTFRPAFYRSLGVKPDYVEIYAICKDGEIDPADLAQSPRGYRDVMREIKQKSPNLCIIQEWCQQGRYANLVMAETALLPDAT